MRLNAVFLLHFTLNWEKIGEWSDILLCGKIPCFTTMWPESVKK